MRYGKDMFDFKPMKPEFLDRWMRILKFTLWAGAGWSELSEKNLSNAAGILTPANTTDDWYHEFGFGIGDRFNFLRADIIRNSISGSKILFRFNILQ